MTTIETNETESLNGAPHDTIVPPRSKRARSASTEIFDAASRAKAAISDLIAERDAARNKAAALDAVLAELTHPPTVAAKPAARKAAPKQRATPAEDVVAKPVKAARKGPRGLRAESVPSRVLWHLNSNGPQTGSQLSGALGLTPQQVHGALNGLLNSSKVKSKGERKSRVWSAV